jgi:hypothetical protein
MRSVSTIAALILVLVFSQVALAKRSAVAKHDFKQQHHCPSTGEGTGPCPGYVIDHIKPLACSGADRPSNMQWQPSLQ